MIIKGEAVNMYNKNKKEKVEYQVIIENKLVISYNTSKKRNEFIKRLNGSRRITCITNVSYPWDIENGLHATCIINY